MRKKTIKEVGYNRGDKYEEKITNILIDKNILPKEYKRAGASNQPDIEIDINQKKFNVEIKAKGHADYGQSFLKWEKNSGWNWSVVNETTKLYEKLRIIEKYIDKDFKPKRFTKEKLSITDEDRKDDYAKIDKKVVIPISALFEYYKEKNCYYIQIEGSGFYHLSEDIAKLGTIQFDGKLILRLRVKPIDTWEYKYSKDKKIKHYDKKKSKYIYISNPSKKNKRYCTGILTPWNYAFLGVLNVKEKGTPSKLDIEKAKGKKFPFK